MYTKLIGIVAVVSTLVFGQSAFAESQCVTGIKRVVESLNLDDSQKDKIKTILEQMKTTMSERATQMESLNTEIAAQVKSDDMDQSKLNSLVDKKATIIGDLMKTRLTATNAISKVLTPTQKTELQTKLQEVEDKIAEQFKGCDKE